MPLAPPGGSAKTVSDTAPFSVEASSELLRFAAVGSVDDGKSTLIGRLLHDTKQLFDDQLEAISLASRRHGGNGFDLAYITDGLRFEREHGITIDVAYRYAATPYRKLVIADCPGHVQYTRNMATGASTADLVVVVVDVTTGLREQTRRHCCIAALLGVRHLLVAVNKMDLAFWDRSAYLAVDREIRAFAQRLGIENVITVPVSALEGDNVASVPSRSSLVHRTHDPRCPRTNRSRSLGHREGRRGAPSRAVGRMAPRKRSLLHGNGERWHAAHR